MANRLIQKSSVEAKAFIVLSEVEIAALGALAGYGIESFLKVFYTHMGECYLRPHENGLRSLFETIQEEAPSFLRRAQEARKVFLQEDNYKGPRAHR